MKEIVFIILFLLSGCLLTAQNKIEGNVKDNNNIPLPGTTVFLPELNKGTIAGKNGHYELTNLPDGKVKIEFSFIGYINKMETVELNGPAVKLNVSLQPTVVTTDEIVISGGYSSTQHENAVKIESVKLDLKKFKSTPDFTEMLKKIPGVSMISKGNGVSKPVIRGLSMNDILVLNNGVRNENYQYSDHHPLGIDEFGIENIEVIKGPASLLYGSDAIGGVINFIREKPAAISTVDGDYTMQLFSNSLGITNNFGIKGSSKKFFGGIRAGVKTNADYLQGGGKYVPNTRFNEYSVKTITGVTGKTGTFNLFYDYNNENLGLAEPEAVDLIDSRGRKTSVFYERLTTNLLSSRNKLYLGKTKIDINSAFQNTELTHFGDVNEYEIQMHLATLTYETRVYLPSDKYSEYILGFQGMNQKNANLNDRETKLLPDAVTNNYSVFTLLQKTFLSKLKLQAGLRFDNKSIISRSLGISGEPGFRQAINKKYNSFSGSFGSTYNINDKLLFRANFAAAFRTPNLAELTSNGPHENRYEIGDPGLHPENSIEYDLSMHIHRMNFTFDLAGFYNAVNNYIFSSPTADTSSTGIRIYRYMQSNSMLFGGEAGIEFHPDAIRWLNIVATLSTVTGKRKDGNYLPFIPADFLYLEMRFDRNKLIFLDNPYTMVTSTMTSSQNKPAPGEDATSGYALFDISAGGNIKMKNQSLTLIFSMNNIFDKKYIDHLSTLNEIGCYNPGRNFTMTIKIPFIISS